MIDVKELRIGAHISVNEERVVVDEIINDSQVAFITPDNDWMACDPKEDWIKPIPLAAELLQEIGFACIEQRGSISVWERSDIHICIFGERIAARIENGKNSPSILSIRYLHELEAFVYLTTKQELIKED